MTRSFRKFAMAAVVVAATDTDIKQLFHVLKIALSRAVAACVPESEFDDVKRVAVTLQRTEERVSITGLAHSIRFFCASVCVYYCRIVHLEFFLRAQHDH